jgi:hypothetical protein
MMKKGLLKKIVVAAAPFIIKQGKAYLKNKQNAKKGKKY